MVFFHQANVVGQVVVGATTSTGAGRTTTDKGTTTTTTCLKTHFLTTYIIMGPLAAMGAVGMAETTDSALALYVDPHGIMPSSVQRATSPKHPCFFPPGKDV